MEKRIADIRKVADVYVVNKDTPDNSRLLKDVSKISVPVLLDNDLKVTKSYDMHSRPGLPMGAMRDIPTMGLVIIDGEGIIRKMRAHTYFGQDADYILKVLQDYSG